MKSEELSHIARAGTYADFERGCTFANPTRPFAFAVRPADLAGKSRAEVLARVGWSRESIAARIGQEIAVAVVDTRVPVLDHAGQRQYMKAAWMDGEGLRAAALADRQFMAFAQSRGLSENEVGVYLPILASPGSGAPPARIADKLDALLVAVDRYFGIRDLGARRIAVQAGGTGFRLTGDNYSMVRLGVLTAAEVDALPPISRPAITEDLYTVMTHDPRRVLIAHLQAETPDRKTPHLLSINRDNLRWVVDTLRACAVCYAFEPTLLLAGGDQIQVFESGPEEEPIVNLANVVWSEAARYHLTMTRATALALADSLAELAPRVVSAPLGFEQQKWLSSTAQRMYDISEKPDLVAVRYIVTDMAGMNTVARMSLERANLGWLLDTLRAAVPVYGAPVTSGGGGDDRFEISEYGPQAEFINIFNRRASSAPDGGLYMLSMPRQAIAQLVDELSALR